jgi:UDP-glucose 4-epimerase
MKKVLITGNSGYIGSHLSKMLAADYELYGIDINTPQSPVVEHYSTDIRALTGKTIVKFDTVIHLAAVVRINQSELNPKEYYTTNLNGTLNILENISYKNFIFASTGAAEACFSPYGVSKRAAEDCIREYCVKNKINYTMFRFYNVFGTDGFGPTNPDGLMFNLLKSKETGTFTIFGNDYDTPDGTCVRDYVHVNEICDAIKTAIENPSNSIECLGHGVGHSVLEMARLFEQINDVTIDVTFANRRDGDLPISVLKNVSPYMKNLYPIQQLLKV